MNGSRGAGQKCRARSREAKWEGEVQRRSAMGEVIENGGGGCLFISHLGNRKVPGSQRATGE